MTKTPPARRLLRYIDRLLAGAETVALADIPDIRPLRAGVYVLRDYKGGALYVGQSGDIRSRVRTHLKTRKSVVYIDILDEDCPQCRLFLETAVILALMLGTPPPDNRAVLLSLHPSAGPAGRIRPATWFRGRR